MSSSASDGKPIASCRQPVAPLKKDFNLQKETSNGRPGTASTTKHITQRVINLHQKTKQIRESNQAITTAPYLSQDESDSGQLQDDSGKKQQNKGSHK